MKDIRSQKFETEQTLKINKQCNISNKTNPQSYKLTVWVGVFGGILCKLKTETHKVKNRIQRNLLVPWVPETFHARFPVSVKCIVTCAKNIFWRSQHRPCRPEATHGEKNLWYPGYLRENLFIQSRTPSFTAMQKQPKKKFKGKKNPLMHKPTHLP